MAVSELQNSERIGGPPFGGPAAKLRSWLRGSADRSLVWLRGSADRSLVQKMAGTAFLIRVFSAGLIYLLQIALARWMGIGSMSRRSS